MRKKTYKLTIATDDRDAATTVILFVPAGNIPEAVAAHRRSSEFGDWVLRSIREVEGIVLWKGKTQ
jgi:hypothetical protein